MTETNVQPIPSNSQHHDTPNNKTHVIKFRVTAEEKTSLELTCKLLNLSLSTFIRRAILLYRSSWLLWLRFWPGSFGGSCPLVPSFSRAVMDGRTRSGLPGAGFSS